MGRDPPTPPGTATWQTYRPDGGEIDGKADTGIPITGQTPTGTPPWGNGAPSRPETSGIDYACMTGWYREKAPDSEGIADVSPCPRSANDFTHLAARYRTALFRVHGWAFAVDPPLSFDRSPALTGSVRRRFPLPALWPRRKFHLVSAKTA
jgi:hypothetical protein